MSQMLKSLAAIMNELHHVIGLVTERMGLELSDKDLHFWTFGLFGVIMFILVDMLFRQIAKWSISALSFLYTLTFLAILAISIEVQQRITQQGAMQFSDIAAGLLGFLVLFVAYALSKTVWDAINRIRHPQPKDQES